MNHDSSSHNTESPHESFTHEREKETAYKIESQKRKRKTPSFFREIIQIALIAVFIVLPVRLFIAQPFIVSGESMSPTFETGNYLIIDELSYHLDTPERFDVVVFRFPEDPKKFFIKRVIGLPGESIQVRSNETIIRNEEHPEGLLLLEPYVIYRSPLTTNLTLGDDEYFVMGDNRESSSDSRVWGPLPRDNIVGRALVRLLPIHEFGILPGKARAME